ncbi:MAG: MFS transporter [Candidatus ainarchaeum sp.]|nr:MFS transporter [Candidatus ainarchaeum sp.]
MFDKQTLGLNDLKFSIMEGFFAVILLSASISFIIPYAIYLGATSLEIGFLTAFPALFAAWAQLFSIRILDVIKSRKKMVIIFCFLQILLFIPIMFIQFILNENQIFWVILFYTFSLVTGALAGPIWQSWMKSIVPNKIMGSFLGFRNSIVGVSTFAFLLIFGFSLKLFEAQIGIVFFGIFLSGVFGRFIGTLLFFKISEPKEKINFEKKIRFIGFVKNLKKNKFGYFILYGSLMSFGIALTGPFVGYHYLENLGLKNDYFIYTILISTAMIASIIGMTYWGKIINQFGSIKTLKATSRLVIFFPILYVIIRNPLPLLLVQFFDGLLFSGFNLALATFVYDYSSSKKIIRFGTYQAIFFGTAIFFGAIISGFLQTFQVNFFFISNSFYLICLISVIVRFIVFKKYFKKVTEVKQVDYIKTNKLVYSILTFEPVMKMIPKIVLFDDENKKIKITIKKRIEYMNKIIDNQSNHLTNVLINNKIKTKIREKTNNLKIKRLNKKNIKK